MSIPHRLVPFLALLGVVAGCAPSPAEDTAVGEGAMNTTPGKEEEAQKTAAQDALDRPFEEFIRKEFPKEETTLADFEPKSPGELKPNAKEALLIKLKDPKMNSGIGPAPRAWRWAPDGSPGGASYIVIDAHAGLDSLDFFLENSDRRLMLCVFADKGSMFSRCVLSSF